MNRKWKMVLYKANGEYMNKCMKILLFCVLFLGASLSGLAEEEGFEADQSKRLKAYQALIQSIQSIEFYTRKDEWVESVEDGFRIRTQKSTRLSKIHSLTPKDTDKLKALFGRLSHSKGEKYECVCPFGIILKCKSKSGDFIIHITRENKFLTITRQEGWWYDENIGPIYHRLLLLLSGYEEGVLEVQ